MRKSPMSTRILKSIEDGLNPETASVLLVDDEPAIRAMVARDIRSFSSDITLYEASNGLEALDRLTEIRSRHSCDPLLIVLDLQMPIMDGWEFITRLKTQYENEGRSEGIPIVVLSSTSGEEAGGVSRKTVHDRQSGYVPMITVAKENCHDKHLYNVTEKRGFMTWLEFLLSREEA